MIDIASLEKFRGYLGLPGRLQLNGKMVAKLDASGNEWFARVAE